MSENEAMTGERLDASWYDDARITEAQLDAIWADLGGNGRAQYSRAAMRKVMAEVERLRGHLNAIATAHEEGVMARRRLDEIRDQEQVELKQRAETAERELAEVRERIGHEDVEWSVRWHEDGAVSEKRHTEAEARERGDANPKTMATVSRLVGEWKAASKTHWGVRWYDLPNVLQLSEAKAREKAAKDLSCTLVHYVDGEWQEPDDGQ